MTKVWFTVLNDDNKGKSLFQAIVTELSKQPKKKKEKEREHLRSVISSVGVGAVSSVLERLTDVLLKTLNTFRTLS